MKTYGAIVKHTEGPWKSVKQNSSGYFFITANNKVVCEFGLHREHSSITELADAMLVASAPDLLKVCKATLERLMNMDMGAQYLGTQNRARVHSLIGPLASAIEKAIGEVE